MPEGWRGAWVTNAPLLFSGVCMSVFSYPLPESIAVLGPGLLGGSILMALREKMPGLRVNAWSRREEVVHKVKEAGLAARCSTNLAEVVEGVGLVILCTPVETMAGLAGDLAKLPLGKGVVVTDVGSVKASVVAAVEEAFGGTEAGFVGSHPMAGSERAGLESARPDLFLGQVCLVTPTLFTTDRALGVTLTLWETLGCRVLQMSPEEHDRKVARISHLPHLAASAVTLAALRGDVDAALCAGNGFRDTTRVSSGDADLWTGIVLENRAEVLAALREARDRFSDLVAMLENLDEIGLRRFLQEAKALRDAVAANN